MRSSPGGLDRWATSHEACLDRPTRRIPTYDRCNASARRKILSWRMPNECPVCAFPLKQSPDSLSGRDALKFTCVRCGTFELDNLFAAGLADRRKAEPEQAALVSHVIRRSQSQSQALFLDAETWDRIVANVPIPTPLEQLENLILWLGRLQRTPGQHLNVELGADRAVVGALSDDNFFWLLKHAFDQGLLDGGMHSGGATATLSFRGWQLLEEIHRAAPRQTRRAFIAMLYGNALMDKMFSECFRPGVARAGFELVRLDEKPRAGSIDDRLRLEIRRSRFLIADLTFGNQGAYWEAGFAEGLGKPVIYTCERGQFDTEGTHFDTNHLHTVIWSESDMNAAADLLTLTIRTTLPGEAKLED